MPVTKPENEREPRGGRVGRGISLPPAEDNMLQRLMAFGGVDRSSLLRNLVRAEYEMRVLRGHILEQEDIPLSSYSGAAMHAAAMSDDQYQALKSAAAKRRKP